MKQNDPIFKLTANLFSLAPLSFALMIFGGATVWLYLAGNGAAILTGFLTVFIIMIGCYALYRTLFVKVLIYDSGFYYRKGIGTGRYYRYTEITDAWKSEGKGANGTVTCYLNFQTASEQTEKFAFTAAQANAVLFLLEKIDDAKANNPSALAKQQDYILDAKQNGLSRLIILGLLFIFFSALTVIQLTSGNHQQIPVNIALAGITLCSLILLLILANRYFFVQIRIGADGFYLRSHPFNGKYYLYSEVKRCFERVVTSRRHGISGSAETVYRYYFTIVLKNGKRKSVPFEKDIYEREIEILRERIENQTE